MFADLGTPGWVIYAVGVCELAGSVGLWLRRTSVWVALGIAGIMLGTIYYHLSFPPQPAGLPAPGRSISSQAVFAECGGQ